MLARKNCHQHPQQQQLHLAQGEKLQIVSEEPGCIVQLVVTELLLLCSFVYSLVT